MVRDSIHRREKASKMQASEAIIQKETNRTKLNENLRQHPYQYLDKSDASTRTNEHG